MPQQKLKELLTKLSLSLKKAHKHITFLPLQNIIKICGSSWRIIALTICSIVFLYYPLGGLIINDIDTDTSVEISAAKQNRSATVETISYLIRKEVNDKIWTPNLPFFYPSYFLDNMPEFQLGIIEAISSISQTLAERWETNVATKEEQLLTQADKLLHYPPTIWMFSAENKLMPAPSAHSQYRKARKLLIKFNQGLSDGNIVIYKTPQDLIAILKDISIDLHKTAGKLENHIREESPSYNDNQADNLLYRAKGFAYADYMLLKALGLDYKNILVDADIYADWTRMLKALENAAQLNPLIVRNGEINSIFSPNHLTTEGFYLLKARSLMQKISYRLEQIYINKKEQQ